MTIVNLKWLNLNRPDETTDKARCVVCEINVWRMHVPEHYTGTIRKSSCQKRNVYFHSQ